MTDPSSDSSFPLRPDAADIDEGPLLVEAAWEVCNQVGGIYTVLRSKVPAMTQRWGDRYCLMGPYNPRFAEVEFEPCAPTGPFGQAVMKLRTRGLRVHFGRWLVSGRPLTILFEIDSVASSLGDVKYRLWEDHGISSGDDREVDDAVAYGELSRLFLWELSTREPGRPLLAHFHEWQAGVGIPMLRHEGWPGAMVFTTHATLIGRYLAMGNPQFYDHLGYFDGPAEARKFNIEARYGFERAAAHAAHVFTTVSDVTGQECTQLLGRTPDMLLPNGLNIKRFTAIHEFQTLHKAYKDKLHEFTLGHFFPSYHFDLDETLYMFTSGRYEYLNKGLDVTIEALARLNHRLREVRSKKTIVFFIITKAPFRSISVQSLESRAMLREFHTVVEALKESVGEGLYHAATRGEIPDLNKLVPDYWRLRMRRAIAAWERDSLPSITTHDLVDNGSDPVMNQLRSCHLFNGPDDPVKVVFHPDFVRATSPLFGLEYEQFVRACHLGVFPSFYEPWGYTPLESMALGIPAVTSDLSGFGSYLAHLAPDHAEQGVYIVPRRQRDFYSAAESLTNILFDFAEHDRRERVKIRNRAEALAQHFDWSNLTSHYHEAHDLALARVGLS